jgi:hypothetical protein
MTLADLADFLIREPQDEVRWKLVWEFLEEHRWEPPEQQPALVAEEPTAAGDERWDALLAALAEHLNAKLDLAPPAWTEPRVLDKPWFPSSLAILRAQALVWAPAASRKHGVYLTAHDLEAA